MNYFTESTNIWTISDFIPNNTITFRIKNKDVIVLTPDTFTYNGETIKDVDGVYKSMVDFFKSNS